MTLYSSRAISLGGSSSWEKQIVPWRTPKSVGDQCTAYMQIHRDFCSDSRPAKWKTYSGSEDGFLDQLGSST